jgi:Beta protein
MNEHPIYVPILKGKEGEFAALQELKPNVWPLIMPLIEIPSVPHDYVNDRPAKSLDDHVAGIPERLSKCSMGHPLYLDLPSYGVEEHLNDGRLGLDAVLADCRKYGVNVVPVVSRASSDDYLSAAGLHGVSSGLGVCVRLPEGDFNEDIDLETDIARILSKIGAFTNTPADLILDLQDIGSEGNRSVVFARYVFSLIPRKDVWRRIILAAASFPEDLSDVEAATTTLLPRYEWNLWQALLRKPNGLPRRDLIYGDYAVSNPVSKVLDPRTMAMSANIRYTTRDKWLVVKGRSVRQHGFSQYFELCESLVARQEYSGRNFSWGDSYIDDCALAMKGPGNATTWRKVGVNHHLTLVAKQLANQIPGS